MTANSKAEILRMCIWFIICENMYECTHAHLNIKNFKNQN